MYVFAEHMLGYQMNPLLNVKYIKTPKPQVKNKKKLNVLGSKGG